MQKFNKCRGNFSIFYILLEAAATGEHYTLFWSLGSVAGEGVVLN